MANIQTLDDTIFAIGEMKLNKEYYDQHKKQCDKEKNNKIQRRRKH